MALLEASGPLDSVGAGWWVDFKFRNRGFGKAVVVELVHYLKGQGYTGIGHIRIQTHLQKYDRVSQKLKELFVNEFARSQQATQTRSGHKKC